MGKILRMGMMGSLGLVTIGFALGLLAGNGAMGMSGLQATKVGRFRTVRYRRKAAS
ncbi:hypothetical protein GTO89_00805 [Heliobacterium gestii]|uniref:Uncharacterized protein n=1 Tax=Heliomicrobium gestii TaxID=2699 RepID=A0A845L9H5_HELGE|nr:hypothetical protein [Heliomicrobium gestii]MBM7865309.1 hypothetical protein [Heliomicrobium gestii]MZP41570.1 hypothetical protein [Heliomicrobium gestii]